MRISKKLVLVLVASSFVAVGLGGCKKEETPGQKVDNAVEKAKEGFEKK
jgi:hypothetical protein